MQLLIKYHLFSFVMLQGNRVKLRPMMALQFVGFLKQEEYNYNDYMSAFLDRISICIFRLKKPGVFS